MIHLYCQYPRSNFRGEIFPLHYMHGDDCSCFKSSTTLHSVFDLVELNICNNFSTRWRYTSGVIVSYLFAESLHQYSFDEIVTCLYRISVEHVTLVLILMTQKLAHRSVNIILQICKKIYFCYCL